MTYIMLLIERFMKVVIAGGLQRVKPCTPLHNCSWLYLTILDIVELRSVKGWQSLSLLINKTEIGTIGKAEMEKLEALEAMEKTGEDQL